MTEENMGAQRNYKKAQANENVQRIGCYYGKINRQNGGYEKVSEEIGKSFS